MSDTTVSISGSHLIKLLSRQTMFQCYSDKHFSLDFSEVFKAKHKQTKKLVALKKVLMENEKEGFPITALREIRILQLLKNENVVNLIEICRTKR